MKTFKYRVISGFIILTLFSLNIAACGTYNEFGGSTLKTISEKTFNTTPGKNFTLKASSGDVKITTSDAPQVYIKVLGNEIATKKINLNFDDSENGITVTAEKEGALNFFNFGNNIRLRFEIILPVKYSANISRSGGDISISNLQGETILHTSGGDISIDNLNGSLKAFTSGGDINCTNINGPIKIQTSGGDIICSKFVSDLDASTSGGNISLDGKDAKIKASTSGGEIKLIYSGDNKGIDLSSSGGSINLILPSDFNASAKMYTSGGTIDYSGFSVNNVTKITSTKFEADLNKGGNPLIVKTSGGDIDLRKQ